MVVVFGASCSDSSGDRYSYHVSLESRTFGDDQRTTATISPGYVASACSEESGADVCLWASGPLPGVRIANGRTEAIRLTVTIENVGEAPQFSVVQTRLFSREEQEQVCIDRVKPPPVEIARQSGTSLTLTIPACRALVLKQELPPEKDTYRIAVAGALSLDESSLDSFFAEIAAAEPDWDFIALLGNTRVENASNVAATLKAAIRESAIPVGVGLGDYEIDRGFTEYLERFGATNYITSIGLARVLALDTATRSLSDRQFSFLEDIPRDGCGEACPAGAVLTWASPLGPSNADRRGFQSQFVAQSTIAALDDRGFEFIAAGAFDSESSVSLGEITSYQIGQGDTIDALATITIEGIGVPVRACYNPREPRSTPQLYPDGTEYRCTESELCVAGICRTPCGEDSDCGELACFDQHFCRQPCDSDEDCAVAASCEDGWCRLAPTLSFSR